MSIYLEQATAQLTPADHGDVHPPADALEKKLRETAETLAREERAIVITGGTGTGKSSLARLIVKLARQALPPELKAQANKRGLKLIPRGIEPYFSEKATGGTIGPDDQHEEQWFNWKYMAQKPQFWDDPNMYELYLMLQHWMHHLRADPFNETPLRQELRLPNGAFAYLPEHKDIKPPGPNILVMPFAQHVLEMLRIQTAFRNNNLDQVPKNIAEAYMENPKNIIDILVLTQLQGNPEIDSLAMRALRELPQNFKFFLKVMILHQLFNARDRFMLDLKAQVLAQNGNSSNKSIEIFHVPIYYSDQIVERNLTALKAQLRRQPQHHLQVVSRANVPDLNNTINTGRFVVGQAQHPTTKAFPRQPARCCMVIPGTEHALVMGLFGDDNDPLKFEWVNDAFRLYLDACRNPVLQDGEANLEKIAAVCNM